MAVLANFQIRTIDFISGTDNQISEVSIRFDSSETNGDYFNGSIRLTIADYESKTSLNDLATIVKSKIQEKFAESKTV